MNRNDLLLAMFAAAALTACAPTAMKTADDSEDRVVRTGSHIPAKESAGRSATADPSALGDLRRQTISPGGVGGVGGGSSN